MPAKAKNEAIARQWALLKLLPSRPPGKSARELTDGLEGEHFRVTKRTVERDLLDLELIFPITCNNRGTPRGWHWTEDARVDLPGMSVAEALSLRLIAQYLKPLMPSSLLRGLEPRFQLASSKLAAIASSNQASRWMEKVAIVAPTLALVPPNIDNEIFETVQEALMGDEQLEVAYQSAGKSSATQIRLHPLALVQRGPVSYLVASAFQYDSPRQFALHRFRRAERVKERVRRPKDFSLDRYIASGAFEFGSGAQLALEATVSKQLAGYLAETPLAKNMKLEERNGGVRLFATVADSPQLRWWILSHGPAIQVLKPTTLKTEIVALLQAAAACYG
ncbi:MAG TPA: WYL domain-containing protein [Verrucomicrobiae bacterium]|nr:WYL domain-containing protein [Verrucomicrobiae bacterium]